VGVSLMGDK